MRLTLRTLLAYLDNTLDPQDAEALRQKLTESGFATQMVQRIQGSLSGSLSAPSPEAVGPVEQANVISEYLDSTLPSEQVAEIERACLESGPHLAEAAACHQILTMILGKSAEVSPELRQRIYELPEREVADIATAPSFSGISMPVDRPSPLDAPPDDVVTSGATAVPSSQPVTPVGVNDTGVSDAPTRLRQAEAAAAGRGSSPNANVALAGAKPRTVNESTIYGGTFRPSRIAPWVVSLALVAALGFAIVRIFEPLWKPKEVAEQSRTVELIEEGPVDDAAEQAVADSASDPSDAGTTPSAEESDSTDPAVADEVEMIPPPPPLETPESATTDATVETESDGSLLPPAQDAVAESSEPMEADDAEALAPPLPIPAETSEEPMVDDVADSSAPPLPPPVEEVADDDGEAAVGVATMATESSLVAARIGEAWEHLKKDDVINAGIPLLIAPTFRADFVTDNATITFVGPSIATWDNGDPEQPVLQINNGRLLVKSSAVQSVVHLRLDDQPLSLRLSDEETVVALSVQHYRAPGLDPLVAENRRLLAGALVMQGGVEVTFQGETTNLLQGQQWTKRGSADPQVASVEFPPTWANPNVVDPLQEEAQEGLVGLIEDAQPVEIELREARLFRRSEVGALAAQTLLLMGQGDVYFGGDGILSDAKQRSYWSEHFDSLQSTLNQSADSAMNLRAAIVKMDSANAIPLFRLLTGFSQTQLVEGGDEELVKLLDSSSMAVRVLALENLEAITGTTLYFRPEQENAVRREPQIKKWIARQRKGDIRWQE